MTKTLAVFLLLAGALAPTAYAADAPKRGIGIAAVVGDEAVSSVDVENRLRFIIVTAKLSDTPDVIQHVRPQVLRSLIDEKLELQEAGKNDVKINDEEIRDAIAAIEQQRGMDPGAIEAMLSERHVPESTFIQQIRAQLSWNKLMTRKVRPQVRISDEEIKLASRKLALPDSREPQEMQIAVIAMPVDKPARDAEVRKLADKLAHEVQGGASFEEVSRQFSSGGKPEAFWVRPEQLEPAVVRGLTGARTGFVSAPIRTTEGYSIVKVYGTRALAETKVKEVEVTLKEILLTLKDNTSGKETDAIMQIGEEVARHPGTCEEKGVAGISDLDDFAIEVKMYRNLISDLPSALKTVAEGLKVGEISPPFASDEGIRLYMLCGKKDADARVDRERVYAVLLQQKMQLEAQKYLRNLRRDTFIDIRQ